MKRYIYLTLIISSGLLTGFTKPAKPRIDWVKIPAGSFAMGSSFFERYRHPDENRFVATISAFKMSKYEVTVGQFKAFVDATGYLTDSEKAPGTGRGSLILYGEQPFLIEGVTWRCDEKGRERRPTEYNHPVIHVSWNDAKAFADWMGCRLPTEAEWEYACRANTATTFYTGDRLTTAQANINGDKASARTLPVGSFEPNPFGLYDMHGNVWEWCNDWYDHGYSSEPKTDPKGPKTGWQARVYRGGAWFNRSVNCRAAFRGYEGPTYRDSGVGFRLASGN